MKGALMSDPYTLVANLAAEIEPPPDGTLSRTLHQDERLKVVLFGFSAGQELSEHTASTPAIMHFLKGEATVTLGDDKVLAKAGTWVHMPPNLKHSIRADTPVSMLLLLLK
jgi:quercetin dioxygenase-like cupin family protein